MTETDILDGMTRAELVAWVRSNYFVKKPTKRWLLFNRWEVGSIALRKTQDEHLKMNKDLDFGLRDKYAKQFNETKDYAEKSRLLNLIEPYDKRLKKWIEIGRKLDAEQKRLDTLYEDATNDRD